MKRYASIAAAILCLMFVAASCPNTQKVAYQTIYTLEKSTTAAYDSYLDLVIAGKTATNGVPKVSHAYNDFQTSTMLALQLVQFNTNAPAPATLVTSSQNVIATINANK